MVQTHSLFTVPRKPVPRSHHSLRRPLTRSHSTLYRTWDTDNPPLQDYERSLYKFPWLLRHPETSQSSHPSEPRGDYDRICEEEAAVSQAPVEDRIHLIQGTKDDPTQRLQVHDEKEELANSDLVMASILFLIRTSTDSFKVTWSSDTDPANPRNWPKKRKWTATFLVSCYTFISPVSSTMLAPALPVLADELKTRSDIETYFLMSIFLLAYAIGPFVLAPLSEMYGRVVVLQSANLVFLVFNTVAGFSTNKDMMLATRFLSGLGGSAPQAVSLSDLSDRGHFERLLTICAVGRRSFE